MNKIVVGLTGQSGAGKTTVSKLFFKNGFYVINCDQVSRLVTEKGSNCNRKLAEYFPECFDDEFTLDRRKMGETVFGNEDNLKLLNDTIFPFIIDYINKEIELQVRDGEKFILLDAPTLFEAEMEDSCDYIVSVVADFNIRAERICRRDNITPELAEKRFSSQHSEEFFREKSDFVIENNSDKASVETATLKVISIIKESTDVTQ